MTEFVEAISDSEIQRRLLELHPEYDKIFGPYSRNHGPSHIIFYRSGENYIRRTVSWTRAKQAAQLNCRYDALQWSTKVKLNCAECGAEIFRAKSQSVRRYGVFCDNFCRGKHLGRLIRQGVINNRSKGSLKTGRKSKYPKTRAAIEKLVGLGYSGRHIVQILKFKGAKMTPREIMRYAAMCKIR